MKGDVMKKNETTLTRKLRLNKETLRHLSERELKNAVGGETNRSDCVCPTESCSDGSCSSWRCC
jgi:natural product precursor